MTEFQKPWENCVLVGQGHGKISASQAPLYSEGFSECIAMILKNKNTSESALFHIDEYDLNDDQIDVAYKLIKKYIMSLELGRGEEVLFSSLDHLYDLNPEKHGAMKRDELQKQMEKLNKDGVISARFVIGSKGERIIRNRATKGILKYLGVRVEEDVLADTGDYHWALVYKPDEKTIYVDSKSQKKALAFTF